MQKEERRKRKLADIKKRSKTTTLPKWIAEWGPEASALLHPLTILTKVTMKKHLEDPKEENSKETIREWKIPSEEEKKDIQNLINQQTWEQQLNREDTEIGIGSATTLEYTPATES